MGFIGYGDTLAPPQIGHELSAIQATVAADGALTVALHTTDGCVHLGVPPELLPMIAAEIDRAHMAMLKHKMKGQDRGKAVFDDIVARAPAPACVAATIDPHTAERIILYRFPDRPPIAIRLTEEQILAARNDLAREIRRLSN